MALHLTTWSGELYASLTMRLYVVGLCACTHLLHAEREGKRSRALSEPTCAECCLAIVQVGLIVKALVAVIVLSVAQNVLSVR
jgi:hypothetical protein